MHEIEQALEAIRKEFADLQLCLEAQKRLNRQLLEENKELLEYRKLVKERLAELAK